MLLAEHVNTLPSQTTASRTWDRGSELTAHARFALTTDVQVQFCDPHSPWQRGSNGNTNGLRGSISQGGSLSAITQADLDAVAGSTAAYDRRPASAPHEVFTETMALTS